MASQSSNGSDDYTYKNAFVDKRATELKTAGNIRS